MNKDHIFYYMENPIRAHETFFNFFGKAEDRNLDAPFHRQMIEDWHSPIPKILTMAFRGSGKSTKAEEAITLEVCFGRVRNVLIIGESEARAVERLTAIKHHIEYNEVLQAAFDIGPGDPWQETRACTSTGVMIQAAGRGQSLRGVKHLDARPDFIFLDDIEDRESGSVATPEAREKTKVWLAGTVLPTLAPGGRMRMAATPLHPEALAPTLAKAVGTWTTRIYPIIRKHPDTGEWDPAWPDRFPPAAVLDMKHAYEEIHKSDVFQQEYMCEAVDPASQTFTEDMIVVEPRARSWHAVYAIYDPARTTNVRSATTGKCVASWVGNRLVVWESSAEKWMPDEIVADIFACAERYAPVAVGVEENGLNEWLLQPIRTEQVRRGQVIPLRPLRAPRGKLDFIRGLQPYFSARAVLFADHMPALRNQLLGFPTGDIDAPNALAYMLHMKLGVPIYDNFREENISDVSLRPHDPIYLLVNSDNKITTAIIAQQQSGRLVLAWDAIAEGDAGTVLTDVIQSALVEMQATRPAMMPSLGVSSRDSAEPQKLRLLSSQKHFDDYTIYGLRAACRKLGYDLQRGAETGQGREEIRALLRRVSHGGPALNVGQAATWTLRGFAGGYARNSDSALPIDNAYAVLMEPLEAFAGSARLAQTVANLPNYAYTSDGRRYVSALVQRGP